MAKEKKYVADNSDLLEEWNWEKNNAIGLYPNEISYGSGIKVWWICKEGHEWEATPNKRSRGRGCPICADKIRYINKTKNWIKKRGSLESNNPILASEWHPTMNGELLPSHFYT